MTESSELEVTAAVGAAPPPPPAVSATVAVAGNVATVTVNLPSVPEGDPLITAVEVFHDIASHAGQSADDLRAAGLVAASVPVAAGDTSETVTIPGLPWNTPTVYFDIFMVA